LIKYGLYCFLLTADDCVVNGGSDAGVPIEGVDGRREDHLTLNSLTLPEEGEREKNDKRRHHRRRRRRRRRRREKRPFLHGGEQGGNYAEEAVPLSFNRFARVKSHLSETSRLLLLLLLLLAAAAAVPCLCFHAPLNGAICLPAPSVSLFFSVHHLKWAAISGKEENKWTWA